MKPQGWEGKYKVGKGRKSRVQEGRCRGVYQSEKPGPSTESKWFKGAKDSQYLKSGLNIIIIIYFYSSVPSLYLVASYSWVREYSLWVDSTKT